jgi:glycosyltransferase involved in cell wall biosynthesis
MDEERLSGVGFQGVKILVVHEVNYLSKIIYEFQILPEILSILGHEITIIDYNDSWQDEANGRRLHLQSTVYRNIHRAYPEASITVRRPALIRLPILSRLSGAITAGIEIIRVMQEQRPDVVLLYGLPTVGVQCLLAARNFDVPIVFRAIDVSHELVPNRLLVPATKFLENFVFNAVDFNIALTPHLKKYILSYGVPERRVRLLPSGVDAEMFSPGERNNALMAQWGIGPEDPVILFMGTIYRFSGLDRVIHEFARVLARHPKAKLLIVGSGEDEARLKALVAGQHLTNSVIFTGLQPYSILPDVIRSSDICINPFELNGITENILPTKLFQYMMCEKPVLATSLPGTRTFLSGEEQGVVYATLETFTGQLIDLLQDGARRAVLGKRACNTAKVYDWRGIAQTLVSWLSEVA